MIIYSFYFFDCLHLFFSPLGYLAALGLLYADYLVAVEEAKRVEGCFDL